MLPSPIATPVLDAPICRPSPTRCAAPASGLPGHDIVPLLNARMAALGAAMP
jgi:hypothetical protein